MIRSSDSVIDAVVVGGGPAGLNAALMLGRARRHVLLFDSGSGRNAASHALHGFLSRDGVDPAELRGIGRDQLRTYSGVELVADEVVEVSGVDGEFEVVPSSGRAVIARKLLFAVGVRDGLPETAGLASLYGTSAFHCPYCDAWEVRDQPLAVVGDGPGSVRLALLLLAWSRDIALCTDGPSRVGPVEKAQLLRAGVDVVEKRIARLGSAAGQLERIVFADGSGLECRALFFHGPVQLSSSLPEGIGCLLTETGRVEVDEAGRTSVRGVYAAGDGARRRAQHPATQAVLAAAAGAVAGIALHQELMEEEVGLSPALPPVGGWAVLR